MKIPFGFFLVLFSLIFLACKQDTATQNQAKPTVELPDSALLHQADSLYDLAETITDLKKSDIALTFHQRALAIRERLLKNDIKLVNSYYKVGILYWNDNKFDVADKYLENGRRVAEDINAPFPTIYELYIKLASCKIEAKDFSTAISIVERLLRLTKEHEKDHDSAAKMARAYSSLATIYHYQNQNDKAIPIWLQASKLVPNDHAFLGRVNYSISVAYMDLKQYKLSLFYINRSITEDMVWAGPESTSIADKYLHKAFALLELSMDSVPYYLHRTLSIRTIIFGEKHSYTYGAKRSLGEFYYRIQRFDSAAFYHHESLISLIRGFNNHNFFSNPRPDPGELNPDLMQSLVKKAEAIEKLYEFDSLKTQLLDLSLNTSLLADSVFTGYRKNILHDDPLLRQMEGNAMPYTEMVRIAAKLFEKKKLAMHFEKAFRVMESSRATVLQNVLNRAIAFGSVGISDTILKKENRFSRIRAELQQKMNNPSLLKSVRDSLNEELLLANNQEADLKNELKKENLNYFSLRYPDPPSVYNLRNLLAKQNSVYLEYMWGDSIIYVLMISKDRIRMNSIPVNERFNEAFSGFVDEFRADPEGAIGLDRYKNFCINSSLLYDYLVKDLLNDIDPNSHLIISADGPLSTIPFDALIVHNPKSDEVNYHLPYLVLQHPISYAYSAGVLLNQSNHKREGKKLLAFGYAGGGPARATRSGLTNLPGTEKEILAIKDVMKNHVNQYKLEGEASESFFKQQVPGFDIVHLAVHGEGDTLNALNSRLIFRSEKDTVEDGSLYAHELYDLDLSKLDLAVLSACESGVGKQLTGEGVMSIARGFAYAGCPSLVISLWKINDRTSAKVMKGFYNYLSIGEQLDISLAKAKADYVKGAGEFNAHPFYWAAFLQVGDVRELDIKKPNWWSWVLVGLGGILLIYLLITFMNRPHH